MGARLVSRALQRGCSSPCSHFRHKSSSSSPRAQPAPKPLQALPLGDYYSLLLASSSNVPARPAAAAAPTPLSTSSSAQVLAGTSLPGPSIVFSSRLSSPLERRSEIEKRSRKIAGVSVPPRPQEPDNCCMSGCVDCVWEQYREELEQWMGAKKEAERRLVADGKGAKVDQKPSGEARNDGLESGPAMRSADNDGSTSEGHLDNADLIGGKVTEESLFQDIPIGIREFIKHEKRLKEKHAIEKGVRV